jgi:photosystem II stability/assembly factor-like uncharacterized protein
LPDSGRLLAGTFRGDVFLSDDGGQSWEEASAGLTSRAVRSLPVAADGHALFLGTYAGVFRSDNEGRSWQPAPDLSYDDLPTTLVTRQSYLVADHGTIGLVRPGVD